MLNSKQLRGQHFFYVIDLGDRTKVGVSSSIGARMYFYNRVFKNARVAKLFRLKSQDSTYALEKRVLKFYQDYIVEGLEYIGVKADEVVQDVTHIAQAISEEIQAGTFTIPAINLGTTRLGYQHAKTIWDLAPITPYFKSI